MEKKKLILDVDEVICDSGFLTLINKFLGTDYKIDDFTEYYIDDYALKDEKTKQAFYEYYLQNESYSYATLISGAYEAIKLLNEKYDIYICSACVMYPLISKSGKFFMDKYNYLIETFPFLNPDKFIFTNSKQVISGDIQIDDRIFNFCNSIPLKILFDSYHNQNCTKEQLNEMGIIRVNNWDEIKKILL